MKSSWLVIVAAAALLQGAAQGQQPADQWPDYQHNSNFSPLTQITPANVDRLVHAWTFNYGAGSAPDGGFVGLDYRFEIQPLLIGGVMYISTPGSQRDPELKSTVTALEPETGKVLWQYTSPRNIHGRGLAYWPGSGSVGPRLYFATDKGYLMALDVRTGELAQDFGDRGTLDVYVGVVSPEVGESRRDTYTIPNPVAVYRNLLITGARPGEQAPPQPRGDIRAFDAITGKLVWTFHVIPQPGEPNHETWIGDTWKDRSGCNVWSTMTVDEERGIVFAPTADANRAVPGMNLYCNSILALDANTGKLKWYHQLIHRDVWDMDMPTPPLLVDVQKDGRTIPAVVQTGKMNWVFIFNRETGEPIHGLEERPVLRSDVPDDQSWPLQPFPLKPGPIGRVGMTRDDINRLTPEVEQFCTEFWDTNNIQPSGPYARPMERQSIVTFPGSTGGPNWGPISYNPQLGYVFINLMNNGSYRPAAPQPPGGGGFGMGGAAAGTDEGAGAAGRGAGGGRAIGAGPGAAGGRAAAPGGGRQGGGGGQGRGRGAGFAYRLPSGNTVPCYAPPYGALVAVDVNRGEIAWTSALGLNESLAELGDLGLKTGARNLGGNIATASGLVFIGATNDRRFRAFDARTGAELWSAVLPASGHSTPMTYMGKDGKQYVVIAAAGGTSVGSGLPVSDALVAFRLP
jgi:quinoprotein glucose dehydrogenase